MNLLPEKTVDAIFAAVQAGRSIRQISRELGIAEATTAGYRRLWLAAGNSLPACGCGKTTDHRGWCAVRLARSPARRAALSTMWRHRRDRVSL